MESPFLVKAQEALRAAAALLEQGCPNSAANRAYYAAFHAARAAIIAAGLSRSDRRWSHEGIQGTFSQLTRRKKLLPAYLGRDLADLRAIRELADYELEMVSSRMARDVVKTARQFVAHVQKGISS